MHREGIEDFRSCRAFTDHAEFPRPARIPDSDFGAGPTDCKSRRYEKIRYGIARKKTMSCSIDQVICGPFLNGEHIHSAVLTDFNSFAV